MSRIPVSLRSHLLTVWTGLLLALALFGLYGAYVVITQGLIVTGMNNMVVWGLWIAADLSFISLSAGAFTVSALIYIFRLERFKAIGRVAVFIGLIGYTMTMLTLVLDIGRPDRFWFPLVNWNVTSVLLEVFWCVTLYTAVLVGEFAPTLSESGRLARSAAVTKLARGLHAIMPGLVAAGVVFSFLHQSSLGALYSVVIGRPLWASFELPFLFLISAIASGPSLTLFALLVTSRFARADLAPRDSLVGLGRMIGVVLLVYLVLKVWNLTLSTSVSTASRNDLMALLAGTPYPTVIYVVELGVGVILPAAIFLMPRLSRSGRALLVASGAVIVGLIVDRWDVTILGLIAYDMPPVSFVKGQGLPQLSPLLGTYVPTWPEWATVIGAIAFGLLVYTYGIRRLPIFKAPHPGPS
jgi:molybdopterin-containing oxidoreductase family membrane subunit